MSDEFNVASYPDEFTIVRVGDEFTVEQWPDEFIIHDNTDDWTIYTTTETEYTLEFQAVGLNDAAITIAARNAALAAQVQADADVVLTHADAAATAADRVQTGLDAAATAADRVQTGLDAVATAADRVQTGLDRTQTGLDAVATAADRVQTGLDRTQTGLDAAATAADRVQTGIDVANANLILADLVGGVTGQILIKASNADYDFGWANSTGMLAAIYDPTNIAADVFARANHTGTQLAATISDFSTAADARITAKIGVTLQGYTAILAATTASYTVTLDTKLGGIASGADVTVSALPVAIHGAASKATPVDADELALSDSAAAFGLKKLTWANVKATIWASFGVLINGGVSKATPVDADTLAIADSAAANATKKLTWANLKAGILAYFNTTAKATPIDADRVWQGDSTTANTPVYSTWTQIKAFLKTYFDTVYLAATAYTAADVLTKIKTVDGTGSGLDADLLDGLNSTSAATASTIAARDGSGDLIARLHRTEYAAGGGTGAYFLTQNAIGAGGDNFARPMPLATVKTFTDQDIGAETAALAVGSVGSYAFMHVTVVSPVLTPGQTIAGSSLEYSNQAAAGNTVPSGTWRCMGHVLSSSSSATLFLRIS
jgi:hypothetical protein